MSFLKSDFTRFFTLGFAGGAALVLGTLGLNGATDIVSSVVAPAEAAAQH